MDARIAIKTYCNYQERSHKEVRSKLFELGCRTAEVDEIISELIEINLLNEERYARTLARGKFRLKNWGRKKIIQALKLQDVSMYCINKALSEINEEDYYNTLHKIGRKKWEELKSDKNISIKRAKLYRYLLQKGYEADIINEVYKEITEQL